MGIQAPYPPPPPPTPLRVHMMLGDLIARVNGLEARIVIESSGSGNRMIRGESPTGNRDRAQTLVRSSHGTVRWLV